MSKSLFIIAILCVSGFSNQVFGQCEPNTINTANTLICTGGTLTISANNIPGSQTYLWEVSIDGGPFGAAAGTNTGQNYSLPVAYRNTPGVYIFRRVATDTAPAACSITSVPVTITVVADLSSVTIVPGPSTTVCLGGTVTLSVSATTGGSGNWAYDWERSSTGVGGWANASGTANAATYAVPTTTVGTTYYRQQLDDSGVGCGDNVVSNIISVTVVADPTAPVLAKIPNQASVCTGTMLTISATPGTGGTGTCVDEYRYSTDNGANWSAWSATLPSFAAVAGTNLVEGRRNCDGSGCDLSTSTSVSWTTVPFPTPTISGEMSVCPNAMVQLTGTPGISLPALLASENWTSSDNLIAQVDNTGKVTGVAEGIASITYTVTDNTGCSSSTMVSISVFPLPMVFAGAYEPVCTDALDIPLEGTPPGGTFSGTGVTGNLFDPSVGTQIITYTATDGTGCTNSTTTTITVYPLPTVSAGTYGPVCVDAADVTLEGTPSGGTFSGTGVTGNFFDPTAGTQTITYTYTDENSCTNSATTTIVVNPLPVVSAGIYGPVCADAADVALEGTPAGGLFSGTGVTGNLFDPSVGTQIITYAYTDVNGCKNSATTTITVNPLPTATISGSATVCLGATAPEITISGTGGTAPYFFTYTINTNTPQQASSTLGNSVALPHPTGTAGTFEYTLVSVADNNGCSQLQSGSATISVNTPATVEINAPQLTPETCADPTAVSFTADVLPATPNGGDYTYTWTAHGCLNAACVDAGGFTPPSADQQTVTRAFSSATNGGKSVKVVVATPGCPSTAMDVLSWNQNPEPSTTLAIAPDPVCLGESVLLTATSTAGPAVGMYSWLGDDAMSPATTPLTTTMPPNNTYTHTPTATMTRYYQVVVDYSSWGCDDDVANASVVVNALPTADINVTETSGMMNNDGVLCAGEEATLIADGGVSYVWNTMESGETITVSDPGTYTVTVTDENGCTSSTTTTITVNPLPTAAIDITETSGTADDDGVLCAGDAATLTASGGTSYLWSTEEDEASITVTSSGSYTVTVTDANGCSNSTSTPITVHPLPAASILISETSGSEKDDGLLCAGDAATLTASGGTSYVWSTTEMSSSISVNTAGTYSVIVTDANGCTETDMVGIVINPLPTAMITIEETSGAVDDDGKLCAGDVATLTAMGGVSYLWSND
ncbi:MAG: Ig-like domain-containing protein, partial [Saprospiraceae bacterium]|nr:Ig-like domain-containing protein [Saprospiraceae bacterium]